MYDVVWHSRKILISLKSLLNVDIFWGKSFVSFCLQQMTKEKRQEEDCVR